MLGGALVWDEGPHRATYVVSWLPQSEREAAWATLGISHSDFSQNAVTSLIHR